MWTRIKPWQLKTCIKVDSGEELREGKEKRIGYLGTEKPLERKMTSGKRL